MKPPHDFMSFLTRLIAHGRGLCYKDRYGAVTAVMIQPLLKLDKVNADPATVQKLADCGVTDAIVIGSDARGVPILLALATLKTYLLDPGRSDPGAYLKDEITIALGRSD
jgi:hypothetical protein